MARIQEMFARERATRRNRWLGSSTWLLALAAACSNQGSMLNALTAGSSGPTPPTIAAGSGNLPSSSAGSGGQVATGSAGVSAVAGNAGTGAAGSTNAAGSSAGGGASGASGASGALAMTSAGASGGAGTAGASGTGAAGTGENSLSECQKALKPKCQMWEKAGCSSYLTGDVGTLVKGAEFAFGPYGSIMEYNVGKGFEVPKNPSEDGCAAVASSFGEPADVTAVTADLKDSDLTLYTVYRPACMNEGEKYPVITWGNGTCGQSESYGPLLRYVASYGYVVFASNSRYTGGNGAMTKALDFAAAANKDSTSVYYNRLDMTKIGAMGHSQGGMATVTAANDARVSSVIIWNAATSASKPFLSVSGDTDITGFTPASMARDINASAQPSAWLYYHKVPKTGSVSGHLTLMIQPERVVEPARAWWDYMLKGDTKARDYFIGTNCGLCGKKDEYEFGQKGLK
jgi:pimeloyl-ACP methyl ester carboxylesterase